MRWKRSDQYLKYCNLELWRDEENLLTSEFNVLNLSMTLLESVYMVRVLCSLVTMNDNMIAISSDLKEIIQV